MEGASAKTKREPSTGFGFLRCTLSNFGFTVSELHELFQKEREGAKRAGQVPCLGFSKFWVRVQTKRMGGTEGAEITTKRNPLAGSGFQFSG